MTNREKFKEKIINIVLTTGDGFALLKDTGNIKCCETTMCQDCCFNDAMNCFDRRKKWLDDEYEPHIDWLNIEVDTPILVKKKKNEGWKRRYFAKYENGQVYAWDGGATSWSVTNKLAWGYKYARLLRAEDFNPLPTPIPIPNYKYNIYNKNK